ncbi:hypothetical protein [Corallococcus llansteffanensis]|uniref:Right-handed parallel beta-helix repeat-containing protein n=1 Tax=Corallococcus llansteffanensis TaxID=2316731 RepID=A0A3A8Q8I2_9BACT|nr:hypothetical protein [Corallococcus llansteffanensis]RKH63841.1 hypothetical protein D7V93_08200 [Corallococcus llansteffanensis]
MNISRAFPAFLSSALLLISCGEGASPEAEGVTPATQEQAADTFVLRQTKPTAANTGAGIIRAYPTKVVNGDVTLSTAGQRLADTIVHGRVIIKAANTVVSNCVVDGGPAMTGGGAIIQIGTGGTNARIEFTTVRAANPTYWVNGIGMREYTAYRTNVSGVVDAFSVAPATSGAPVNVSIQGSYGHDLVHFSPDPNHPGTDSRTHNDVLQSHGGSGLEVIGSNFSAYHDQTMGTLPTPNPKKQIAAMMINTIVGPSSNLKIEDNWFGGGVYCINGGGAAGGGGTFLRNRFDRGSAQTSNPDTSYTLVFDSTFAQTSTGNVYEDNGHPVLVRTGY